MTTFYRRPSRAVGLPSSFIGLGRILVLIVFAIVSGLVSGVAPVRAVDVETQSVRVARTVLALYDSRHEPAPHQTRLHKLAEMPLNHLGYVLDYRDVNEPLPAVSALASYRAIVTWFIEPLQDPATYVTWLDRATETGLRYVMLGEIAPREPDELMPAINRVLGRLGLEHKMSFFDITHRSKVVQRDTAMLGFEQKLDKVLPGFPVVVQRRGDTRAHITIETPTSAGSLRSVPVATSMGGGFAAQNYTVALEPNIDRLGWIIDPFRFFKLALGDQRFPIPDVTTVSGRRVYFSHIDGDGWNNQSEIEGYRERQALSAEVVSREAIEPYPDLPVSVGLIAGDVMPLLGGIPAAIPIARRLFALSQVEVASHTHTHPYNWNFFERYDRGAEEKLIASYNPPDQPLREKITEKLMTVAGKRYRSTRYDRYIAGSDELPRTYLRQNFSLETEVFGALRVSESFAPPGKKAKLYLWSGDTTPFEGAIAATRRAGVRNLNGGDSRLDDEYPSVAYVPPIARLAGREKQIYAANSNENTYTNDWTGPFGGQMLLERTLVNTDKPRRLKPFNLYYHMYSGEKPAALRAIRHFLEMARRSEVTPVAASHYAAMADDWAGVEIIETTPMSWVIRNRGAVETVRLDDADALEVDHAASRGVIGSNRHVGAIYVTLDPMAATTVLTLRPRGLPVANEAARGGVEPVATLVQGRWRFSNFEIGDCRQTVTAEGFGPAEMVWRAKPGRGLRVTASRDGVVLNSELVWATADGLVKLRYQLNGLEPVEFNFQCHD